MNIFSSKILTKKYPRYTILCTRRLQPPRDDCAIRVQRFSSVVSDQSNRKLFWRPDVCSHGCLLLSSVGETSFSYHLYKVLALCVLSSLFYNNLAEEERAGCFTLCSYCRMAVCVLCLFLAWMACGMWLLNFLVILSFFWCQYRNLYFSGKLKNNIEQIKTANHVSCQICVFSAIKSWCTFTLLEAFNV